MSGWLESTPTPVMVSHANASRVIFVAGEQTGYWPITITTFEWRSMTQNTAKNLADDIKTNGISAGGTSYAANQVDESHAERSNDAGGYKTVATFVVRGSFVSV